MSEARAKWAKAAVAASRRQRSYVVEAVKRMIERRQLEREYGPHIWPRSNPADRRRI